MTASILDLETQSYETALEEYRLKRLLKSLERKRGRGTELISLYIPPGRQLADVFENLKQEYGKASNIKSRTTRKNVQEAITKITQRLKLYHSVPPNGLVIFCGAIAKGPPGSEVVELNELIPPKPLSLSYYSCDDKFYVKPLIEMISKTDKFGVVLVDNNEATIAVIDGKNIEIKDELTSGVPGKTSKGGQSARRFERLREMELNDFYKRIGEHANEIFLELENLNGIILGGPGLTKEEFRKGNYLNYQLREKVLTSVDTAYTGLQGVKEALEKASATIEQMDLLQERRIVQAFLSEVGKGSGLASYGEDEVIKNLKAGKVNLLLISEALDITKVRIVCSNCDFSEVRKVADEELELFYSKLKSEKCPKCGIESLSAEGESNYLDELTKLADSANAKVELISSKTEEGTMLLKGFGGLAAILKS
ncbi:MAG: peptide chain release factor aRF-1 [Thermoproteota archaeon]